MSLWFCSDLPVILWTPGGFFSLNLEQNVVDPSWFSTLHSDCFVLENLVWIMTFCELVYTWEKNKDGILIADPATETDQYAFNVSKQQQILLC